MSHARKYHEPGVGARTGMRVEEGAFDLDDFMAAGRRAMNGGTGRKSAREEAGSAPAVGGSSLMVIEQSPGPSPRSTIRRSYAPSSSSSSPFLSSPGTARNHATSPLLIHPRSPVAYMGAKMSSEVSARTISSPSRARGPRREVISAGLEARREKRRREEEERERVARGREIQCRQSSKSGEDEGGVAVAADQSPIGHLSLYTARDSTAQYSEGEGDEEDGEDAVAQSPFAADASYNMSLQAYPEGLSEPMPSPPARTMESVWRTPKLAAKEGKGKGVRRPLQEKNGGTGSLGTRVGAKGDIERLAAGTTAQRKRKAGNDESRNGAMTRAVVERIPSSHHRQTSVETGEGQEDGLRRGSRYRYRPLEYWRGEKARFGRVSLPKVVEREGVGEETIDGDAFEDHFAGEIPPVAVLKEIIRVPREEGEGTFSGMKMRRERTVERTRAPAKVSSKREADVAMDPTQPTRHAEAEWDKETSMRGTVWDVETKDEIEMQIACTTSQVRPRLALDSTFGFEKIFVVDHTMATGVLFILVDGQKPLKSSKENNYTFVVLEGAVRVHLHNSDFVIAPHGMFFVPRGNKYSIENISKRTAKVAFTQCRGA